MVSSESVLEYYKMLFPEGIEDVKESDIRNMLLFGVYKELPFDFTLLIEESLTLYKGIASGNYDNLTNNTINKHIVNIRNKETGYFNRLTYDVEDIEVLLSLSRDVYLDFYEYYMSKVNDYYYEMELTNPKAHPSPLNNYKDKATFIVKVMDWYIGKIDTERLLKTYTDTFFTYLEKTKYHKIYTSQEREDAVIYVIYTLYTGDGKPIKLNKSNLLEFQKTLKNK